MVPLRRLLGAAVLLIAATATVSGQTYAVDPYDVLDAHYRGIGGLDRLKAESTRHYEGTLSVGGLEGTIEHWEAPPAKSRTELDLTVVSQIEGDNGEFRWTVDSNGKVLIDLDESAIKRRRVDVLVAAYDHRDPASENFTVSYEGTADVQGTECHVIKTTNTINDDVIVEYFDTSSYSILRSEQSRGDHELHTLYSDYREVGGVLRAFRQEVDLQPLSQVHTVQLKTFEVNTPVDSALFEPPEDDVRDFEFTDAQSALNVPFGFIENHIYMPVTIGGKEGLWVLDTGASVSVIDAGFAAELGLEPKGEIRGQAAGGTVDVGFVTLPPFSIPGIRFDEQQVASLDISSLFRRSVGMDVAGILGYDFLSRFVTRVDYANERLSFYDPDAFQYDGDGTVVDAPLRSNAFCVPATVDGEYTGRWTVDLGASGLFFHYPFALAKGIVDRKGVEAVGFGAGGKMALRISRYRIVEVGGYQVSDPRISTPTDGPEGAAFEQDELIGTMGNTLFRHFVLYLDYGRQQMVFEKGDDFDRDFPVDRSGLQLWLQDEDQLEVLFVAPGTPADEAGFAAGDIVRSINGIETKHFAGIVSIRELLKAEEGTEYRLGVLRDGSAIDIDLTLRDLM